MSNFGYLVIGSSMSSSTWSRDTPEVSRDIDALLHLDIFVQFIKQAMQSTVAGEFFTLPPFQMRTLMKFRMLQDVGLH